MSDYLFEAARYALLRRLAPAIRHSMIGWLQPVVMTAEILERRIRLGDADLEKVKAALAELIKLSSSAIPLCANLVTWLAPEDGALTGIDEGIRECTGLLETDFALRGFTIEYKGCGADIRLSRTALRNVLTASLIVATDTASGPARLNLTVDMAQHHAILVISVHPDGNLTSYSHESAYRPLTWNDAESLAAAEQVELSRDDNRISMHYVTR